MKGEAKLDRDIGNYPDIRRYQTFSQCPSCKIHIVSMVKLAIWNSDYISVQSTLAYEACQPRGGLGACSPRNSLKIRPSKGESESIFSSFSVENNGSPVYYIFKFYFSIKSRLIAICTEYNYHACIITGA